MTWHGTYGGGSQILQVKQHWHRLVLGWVAACTLLAIKLCDSSFLGKKNDLIHSHFNMYGFCSYLFLYIIKWYVD